MMNQKINLLGILALTVVLLLFAAPITDGILTLTRTDAHHQTDHIDSINVFDSIAYAGHSTPPSDEDDKAEHQQGDSWWEKCIKGCGTDLIKYALIIKFGADVIISGPPEDGGYQTYRWKEIGQETRALQTRPHPGADVVQCPPEEEEEGSGSGNEGGNGNDGGNGGGNGND